jgi:hypothetical protein
MNHPFNFICYLIEALSGHSPEICTGTPWEAPSIFPTVDNSSCITLNIKRNKRSIITPPSLYSSVEKYTPVKLLIWPSKMILSLLLVGSGVNIFPGWSLNSLLSYHKQISNAVLLLYVIPHLVSAFLFPNKNFNLNPIKLLLRKY